jgi:hypothetical protein
MLLVPSPLMQPQLAARLRNLAVVADEELIHLPNEEGGFSWCDIVIKVLWLITVINDEELIHLPNEEGGFSWCNIVINDEELIHLPNEEGSGKVASRGVTS